MVGYFCRLVRSWIGCGVVQEIEEVGGLEELEKEINRRAKSYKNSWL